MGTLTFIDKKPLSCFQFLSAILCFMGILFTLKPPFIFETLFNQVIDNQEYSEDKIGHFYILCSKALSIHYY